MSAQTRPQRPLRIAMYAGKGTDPAILIRRLSGWRFDAAEVGPDDLAGLAEGGFDLLYLPGGWYFFNENRKAAILSYVRAGGACVGSCAGAYNVAGFIPLIPGRVLNVNVRGRLYLEPIQGGHPILAGAVRPCTRHAGRQWEPIAVTHLGGPLMYPDDPAAMVAAYDKEGRVGALLAASVGNGRAVALASHPEMDLAELPKDDPAAPGDVSAAQGDASLIARNACLWAAGRTVPGPDEPPET